MANLDDFKDAIKDALVHVRPHLHAGAPAGAPEHARRAGTHERPPRRALVPGSFWLEPQSRRLFNAAYVSFADGRDGPAPGSNPLAHILRNG